MAPKMSAGVFVMSPCLRERLLCSEFIHCGVQFLQGPVTMGNGVGFRVQEIRRMTYFSCKSTRLVRAYCAQTGAHVVAN